MTVTTPTSDPSAAGDGPAPRGASVGRAVALLVLVAAGALVPLLGPSAALHGSGEAAAPGTPGIGLLRAVLFAALCVPLGELFVGRAARRLRPGGARPPGWSAAAAGAGFLAALGLALVVAAGNRVPRGWGDLDLGGLQSHREGLLALTEVNAFLVAGLLALSRRPAAQVWPLGAVVVAEALRAHPAWDYHDPRTGAALTAVHVACGALWAGGLLHALRVLRLWRAEAPAEAAALLGRYARAAALLMAAVTATGVCSALRRMPPGTVLEQLVTTAYGRTLLAKVVLVAAVAALALWARLRLRRAADPLSACVPARAEVALLGLVVAASGLLTALPVPIRWQ
ncbi:CopD family protein [Streptomyces abyssomicinicus]|uniref:CopD family protein n=1 Tax=Streptomyces abyssomicinicus TaxID=574929 RepID=UPI00124FEBB3